MGLPPFREGIEFPNPDFASLARACGGGGFAARKPDELQEASNEAFAFNGPAIVDAVVVADELPNLPHVDLDVIGHYTMTKIKEAILAVTGGDNRGPGEACRYRSFSGSPLTWP
jgi:pyruvate dehydrogenase (quinone)